MKPTLGVFAVYYCLLLTMPEMKSESLLFTTDYGDDSNDCRTFGTSCRTLARTVSIARKGDSIYLHRKDEDNAWLCHEDPISITTSLNLIGYDALTPIGCRATENRLLMLTVNGSGANVGDVCLAIRHASITNVLFVMSDANLTVGDSIVSGIQWQSSGSIGFHAMNSVLEDRLVVSKALEIVGRTVSFQLKNVTVARMKINVTAGSGSVLVSNTTVTNIPGLKSYQGGLVVSFGNRSERSRVTVENSVFEKQINEDPIEGIMNLHDAAFKLIQLRPPFYSNPNVSLVVHGCVFRDNERGLSIMGPLESAVVSDSTFADNIAMHAGAGILLHSDRQSPVSIVRCRFERNAAGAFRDEYVRNHKESFHVGVNEVAIYSACCKGVISLVGKGGAMRVQRGNVTVVESFFLANTASQLGGAVFVDREGNLTINGAYFENSDTPQRRPLEGDVVYSNGVVKMVDTRLNATSASSQVSILCHSGEIWSIEVIDVELTCPRGYRLRTANSSVYRIDAYGLLKSYKLDQLSYFCESCPRNKYSLDFGYLNYSLRFHSQTYFTLLVNGSHPVPAYSGSYVYHDIECQQCPYGGKCLQGISAVSNFWGYATDDNRVRFQRCNKGYCCASADCKGYDRCRENRVGVLCGECEAGYSEAMFTSKCIPNESCDPAIGWPVMVCSAVLYFIFLLFQKDMRDLMFSRLRVSIPKLDPRPSHDHLRQDVVVPDDTTHDDETRADRSQQGSAHQVELKLLQKSNQESQSVVEFKDHCSARNLLEETLEKGSSRENNGGRSEPSRQQPSTEQQASAGASAAADRGVSFLIIIFFYFQDAQLFHIKTVFASADNRFIAVFREFLSGLFKFRVEVFQFMHQFCFLEDMTPVKKMIVRAALVPCVLAQFGVVYFVNRWHTSRVKKTEKSRTVPSATHPGPTFSTKLATGFVLALLFTYQKLATTSFTLLNCVSVGSGSVLFVQGTIPCYQSWQYGVIAYAATCIVPFCLVLLIGPGLLKDDVIRLREFFLACIVPLPFLLRWVWIRYRRYRKPPVAAEGIVLPAECQAVVQILQGPFKEARSAFFGPICGQGFLIGRRLIIVLLYTFVNDTLIRMLCMMLLCFVVLLHHVHVLPYKDERGNAAGSVSAASLVVLAVINLVRAGFEAAEYVPLGPNEVLMRVLEEVENCLMLWFPGAVMGFVIVTLTIKLSFIIAQNIAAMYRVLRRQTATGANDQSSQPTKTAVSRRDKQCDASIKMNE